MTRKDKLLKRFLKNPQSLRYREIESILLDLGFTKRMGKGSHMIFVFHDLNITQVIPLHNNDCDKQYKKRISKLITKFFQ